MSGCECKRDSAQPSRKMRASGFTLIEVMVALAILGLSGVALFSLFSSSLINMSRVGDLHHYQLAGEDLMNRVLLLKSLPESRAGGQIERLNATWAVDVKPWIPANLDGHPGFAIMKIDVEVAWKGRSGPRNIKLESVKPIPVSYNPENFQRAIESVLPQ